MRAAIYETMHTNGAEQNEHNIDAWWRGTIDPSGELPDLSTGKPSVPMPRFRRKTRLEEWQARLAVDIRYYTNGIYELEDMRAEYKNAEWDGVSSVDTLLHGWTAWENVFHQQSMLDWLRRVDGVCMWEVQDTPALLEAGLSAPNDFCLGLVYGFADEWRFENEAEKLALLGRIALHRLDVEREHFWLGQEIGLLFYRHRNKCMRRENLTPGRFGLPA